ncbi:unnamed protein product [Eruca vesicaria subsp. sativa]|uniref:Bifunctional inhibitor/plant lipid transfer protein/seed storage helical domain-containing protein n=1 Tax=Eruca vesicaria subsp. sativa TaxID=29727 RepID=A0ABC8LHN4_ERUVS|nr:unnamed protein product [Eruca vesicaria subsp. sativa]
MAQSILLSILIVLLTSSSFVPIHARNKSQPKSPSPVAAPAPGPSTSDCTSVIYDMFDCLSYLTPGSNDTKPTKVCCGGILSVLQYNPNCVCVGIERSKTMGFAVNNTRARAMPTTCKLPIVAPHCVSESAGTPMTSPSSVESPTSSPSLADSPAKTAPFPSSSGPVLYPSLHQDKSKLSVRRVLLKLQNMDVELQLQWIDGLLSMKEDGGVVY